jgi:hypothetical protein
LFPPFALGDFSLLRGKRPPGLVVGFLAKCSKAAGVCFIGIVMGGSVSFCLKL